ncbi:MULTISPECIES: GFA family protein [Novosphingobium]|jgi:hypothetical protein|uniref:GFA family protein n=1 Tax=Novosphingobium TaxID=165696 RepID=UPI0022F287D9|nr:MULTISPECIES: GFA family protein [Novosphingobium]GLK43185.1 hypothetical protein GCM10017612_11040 [Novosphingobium resinovorum]
MTFSGSCHCGKVAFTVMGELPHEAMSCNCSHCRRKGFLLAFIPHDALAIERGADELTEYRFYKHVIGHKFCPTCGVEPFAQGEAPDGTKMTAVNLRCVPAADLDALTITKVDGARF